MSSATTVLTEAFGRIRDGVHACLDAVPAEALVSRPTRESNSIAWLMWHLTRVQDDHLAAAFDQNQVWHAGGWAAKFALPFDDADTGYGHSPQQVAALDVSADLLLDYHDAVTAATIGYLSASDLDLDRVVDADYDPPVTLGVRLVSVISDDLQHVGQAAYVRGLWEATHG